uniref:RCK N-terminal domain-containing protein n=1 Tax=Araucaria cunninghamii TaxID=56994 RepID=A0A0D6QSU0_ARACU
MECTPCAMPRRGVVKAEVSCSSHRRSSKLLFSHRIGQTLVLSSANRVQRCKLVMTNKSTGIVAGKYITRSECLRRIRQPECVVSYGNLFPIKFRRRKCLARCEPEGSDSVAYADRVENENENTNSGEGNFEQTKKSSRGEKSGISSENVSGLAENVTENVESTENLKDREAKDWGKVGVEVEKGLEECEKGEGYSLEATRELLAEALKNLEDARNNSNMFEERAQKISETAIALKDEAVEARKEVDEAMAMVQQLIEAETGAQEVLNKARTAVEVAEAQNKVALEALQKALEKVKQQEQSMVGNSLTGNIASIGSRDVVRMDTIGEELSDLQRPKSLKGGAIVEEEDGVEDKMEASNSEEEVALGLAQDELRKCETELANCEEDLRRIQKSKLELQAEMDRVNEIAEKAETRAAEADEDVANVMAQAEEAVALELEAAQRVSDAEIALQRAEKCAMNTGQNVSPGKPSEDTVADSVQTGKMATQGAVVDDPCVGGNGKGVTVDGNGKRKEETILLLEESAPVQEETYSQVRPLQGGSLIEELESVHHEKTAGETEVKKDPEHDKVKYVSKEAEQDKSNVAYQQKKLENCKDTTGNSVPKTSTKKSSRFFSASFFSFEDDGAEFTPGAVFSGFISSFRNQLPKVVLGVLLLGAGAVYVNNRMDRGIQTMQPAGVVSGIEEVTITAKPLVREMRKISNRVKSLVEKLPHQEVDEEEASLFDMLWLLLASVIFVPIFQKIPGGSPVLGYLAAGILIGPYGLSIIRHVDGTKAVAEFGVVFLLFNIGLELSVERLSSMKKYVFGLGSAQVLATAVVVGLVARFVSGQPGPAAIVIGNGLALSSTAVVLQVLQERGESTSRHGRATFSVLLFQDLAVVVLLILIPLISPNSSKGGVGFQAIAEALGVAAVKAVVAISAIIAGGRLLLRPIYKQIAENQNAEIFSANTLLVVLGTSLLTRRAGLSMALGAFLAGLLLAETEFSLQVESDIAPYRGLLLGLFFMTVGMSIDPKLLVAKFPVILGTLSLLIGGKTILVALVGRLFGLSIIAGIRAGLLLAPGGEFAFVAFGDAVNQGIMSPQLSSLMFLVVGLSMALTPWLAAGGQLIASRFEQHDVRSLLPAESETDDLQDHIIICGFGRVGQIIGQLLSERLIPFVALDVLSERVAAGRALDLPVYFGDSGSREVLHKVGAERAAAAAITLDTPGANYRTVWALNKNFPHVKTFVRAHDVDHGINLEKAGATAVVPETLEPSLQLAAALLAQAKLPASEIAATINEFRSRHLSELTELCELSGSSPGYGYLRVMGKSRQQPSDSDDLKQEGMLAVQ